MMHRLPAQIGLQVVQIAARNHLIHPLHEIGDRDIEAGEARAIDGGEVVLPKERGTQLLKLGGRHLVIDLVGIAAFHPIHGCRCQCRFDGHYRVGIGGGLRGRFSHQLERLGHMFDIGLA